MKRLLQDIEAVSPIIGAILILAIGITILTNVQLYNVPAWNLQEDLDHLQEMNNGFTELKSNIESSALSGIILSSPLAMGFRYSSKGIFYNPRESAQATLNIQNNTWIEVRYNEMLTTGMDDNTSIKNLSESSITYSLRGTKSLDPFVYEHGLIRRGSSNYTKSAQTYVINTSIYVLGVKGQDQKITELGKRAIYIYPTSQPRNSVIGSNVWLILHTNYPDWWNNTIQNQGGNIMLINQTRGFIIAHFDRMVITMGETVITTQSQKSQVKSPPFRLVKVTPDNENLPVSGTTNIEVDVQDYYNNPVPNVPVNFHINTSRKPGNAYLTAFLLQNLAISGSDGRASASLTTNGPGIYYVDASVNNYSTTFAYTAASQDWRISFVYSGGGINLFNINATLADATGNPGNNKNIIFDTGDGVVSPASVNTDNNGNATTVLDTTTAQGMQITNIRVASVSQCCANITWNTNDTITVTALLAPSGRIKSAVFNSLNIPTVISTSGCVQYGTSPGNYTFIKCDVAASSHSVILTGLQPYTAYYFIVNSSRPGSANVNSTEYMFVTGSGNAAPPASVTNLNAAAGALYITWTWNDPSDLGFDHVKVYIDGSYVGDVAKGVQYFNATYFMPNSTHNITTYTVDGSGNENATGVYLPATTQTIFTYVFGFFNISGTVTNFSSAQGYSGAYATFAEQQTGAINKSNRTINPGKNIASGTQGGIYNQSNLTSNDGFIDVTVPLISGTITQTGYLMNTVKTGVGGTTYWNINPTNGNAPDTSTTIYTGDTGAYVFRPGNQNNLVGIPGNTPADYGWASGVPVNGTTSAGVWSFRVKTAYSSSNGAGTISVYVYKYNATSGSDTYLFNAAGTANHLSNGGGTTETISSAVQPAFTFNSTEYLKVEYWLTITTPRDDALLMFETNSATSYVRYSTNSYALNTTYTFTETNSSSTWQWISINDNSYGDPLTSVSIFNATSGRWESISTSAFTGGRNPSTHVNTVVGASGNASSYDTGSGRINLSYNWTGSALNNSLGIDLINVTVMYANPVYDLNITTNTTGIPSATTQVLQIRYNVSGDSFMLQLWNGSTWSNRSILNSTSLSYTNITLNVSELIQNATLNGNAGNLNTYYLLARYLDVNTTGGSLYLDYQRVNST